MSGLIVGCEILCDLPSQTDRFFGREAELTGMTQLLQSAESRRGIVLCGISGSGKTQLAREYVSREQDKLSAIVWIDAASDQTVSQSFSQGAERIHLRYPQFHQNSSHISDQSVVLEWLRNLRSRKWLVIIDGMDNPITSRSLFQPFDNLLSASGAICITSTSPNAAKACRLSQVSVEHLGIGPASSLILWRALGTIEVQDENLKQWARDAAGILNGYALGLELAGNLIHEGIVRPDTMPPSIFETKYKQLSTIDPLIWNWEKRHTFFDVFDTLYANLVAKDSVAGDLLTLCSIYGPWEIPIEFLQNLIIEKTGDATRIQEPWNRLEELFKDEIKLGLAIKKLHEVFLAKKKHATDQSLLSFSLHGSVCQWRYATIGDQRTQWVVLALQSLTTYLQSKTEHQRKGKSRESETFDVSRKFHPMSTRCLKMLDVDVPGEQLEAPNGVYAKQYYNICSRLAPLLFSCGDYSVASKLFEGAIKYLRTTQVPDCDEALLPLLRGLARCSQKAGDLNTSEECLQSAETVAVKLYGISSDEAADIYTELRDVRDHIATEADNRKRALVASTGPKMTRQHLELENIYTTDEHELAPGPVPLHEPLDVPGYQSAFKDDLASMADLARHLDASFDPDTRIRGSTLLFSASWKGYINTVRLLLERGANPDLANDYQVTPLHVASQHGWLEIARLLVEGGANVNCTTNEGRTPLHVASFNGHIQVVYLLLEKMADVQAKDEDGMQPLHQALLSKSIEIFSLLLKRGADPNATDISGETPLDYTTIHGDVDEVKLLIESGANIHAVDKDGKTPLHRAAWPGDVDKVKLLLDRGADPSIKDNNGQTPLIWVIEKKSSFVPPLEAVVEVLLTAGISCVNAIDIHGKTAISWAVTNNNVRLVKMLLDYHADPTVQDADGNTCLNRACESNYVDIVETLLRYGADWKIRNYRGRNALQTAKHSGHDSIVALLKTRAGVPRTKSERLKSWLGSHT
ncbi:hypothetical protein PFICI_03019 [Pestalotiopsis fici W106-1]|uniref:Uncharacterized protein n=1 Tax=Pestalotiopsis fici (strain W106-1 / CGMCC3.15140) TaxID=1229662 RepID=W3XG58_PESFW|nr:uncharacterized protein PFICI_03019 [Pestalotiopsis fici W106-1]ETS84994.1 hypothetical protein PFICI_03019 [Pestalotiopsis fici W106-1]